MQAVKTAQHQHNNTNCLHQQPMKLMNPGPSSNLTRCRISPAPDGTGDCELRLFQSLNWTPWDKIYRQRIKEVCSMEAEL